MSFLQTFRQQFGGMTAVIQADESLAEQAAWMLSTLEPLLTPDLKEGQRIRMGWSALTVHMAEDGVHFYEPDFRQDPFRDENRDVSLTLQVVAAQTDFLNRTGMEQLEDLPFFANKIILQKGVLERERIAMLRRERLSGDDSGWFVGAAGAGQLTPVTSTGGYEAVYSYQLLRRRPSLLVVLGLPVGCVVIFNGSQIESAVDPENRTIWPPSTALHSK